MVARRGAARDEDQGDSLPVPQRRCCGVGRRASHLSLPQLKLDDRLPRPEQRPAPTTWVDPGHRGMAGHGGELPDGLASRMAKLHQSGHLPNVAVLRSLAIGHQPTMTPSVLNSLVDCPVLGTGTAEDRLPHTLTRSYQSQTWGYRPSGTPLGWATKPAHMDVHRGAQ